MTSPLLGADRLLALAYVPTTRRPALQALWNLDAALGAVLAGGREQMVSRIKLAWWRDALEGLDSGKAPAEPVLEAVANHLLPKGIAGAALAPMAEGWACLLTQDPLNANDLEAYAAGRGRRLFLQSATILGRVGDDEVAEAGEGWVLVDLARHSAEPVDADAALQAARRRMGARIWPVPLRPLGMLVALARRDAEPGRPRWEAQGAPARMVRMLRHRFTGR